MRERLYYFLGSKAFIISIIVIGVSLLLGFGIWGGMKIFKQKEETIYYKVLLIFVDENEELVEGVKIYQNSELIHTTKKDGKFEAKYIEKGTVLSFQVDGFTIDKQSLTIDKNINLLQINLTSYESQLQKTFTTKIIDINGLPIKNANVYEGKTLIGTTDTLGEIRIILLEGSKQLSFKVSGDYFSIPNITIKYDDDPTQTRIITADFLLDKYLFYTDSEGEQHTRSFTVGFNFRTPDGRRLKNVKINYKIRGENTFKIGSGYSIIFENQVFESAFAYVYDDEKSVWLCSPIVRTSPNGGDIYMQEAIFIQATVDEARSSVYSSNGYYFISDSNKVIQVVIPTYENIRFYKEIEYGIPKYDLILVDKNLQPITSIDKAFTDGKFVLK